jgi:hypothetical protein
LYTTPYVPSPSFSIFSYLTTRRTRRNGRRTAERHGRDG